MNICLPVVAGMRARAASASSGCLFLMWSFRACFWINCFSHRVHLFGRSPKRKKVMDRLGIEFHHLESFPRMKYNQTISKRYLSLFEEKKLLTTLLRQTWTGGGRPVSSICTDRTYFKMLKAYRTNILSGLVRI